jgi:hypothetical protein
MDQSETESGLVIVPRGDDDPRELVRQLAETADGLRSRLSALLDELGRRRREALDLRRQMRRHPMVFAAAAVLVASAVALQIVRVRARRRRERSFGWRLGQMRRALLLALTFPERPFPRTPA